MPLETQIEALLFFKPEPVRISALVKILNLPAEDGESTIRIALDTLQGNLAHRGIRLISLDDAVMLGTAPEAGELLESITKAELKKDLGKASVETLTIILYKNPISKSEIDYIRGVNAGFILRNLLIRGLIERLPNPNDKRTFLYAPSIDLLSFLGITSIEELPEFNAISGKIEAFEEDFKEDSDNKSKPEDNLKEDSVYLKSQGNEGTESPDLNLGNDLESEEMDSESEREHTT